MRVVEASFQHQGANFWATKILHDCPVWNQNLKVFSGLHFEPSRSKNGKRHYITDQLTSFKFFPYSKYVLLRGPLWPPWNLQHHTSHLALQLVFHAKFGDGHCKVPIVRMEVNKIYLVTSTGNSITALRRGAARCYSNPGLSNLFSGWRHPKQKSCSKRGALGTLRVRRTQRMRRSFGYSFLEEI